MRNLKSIDTNMYFCWNEGCEDYQKRGEGNIHPAYFDGKDKNILILQCRTCGKRFSEHKGTIFFRKRTKKDTIVKALKATSEGSGIRATGRIFNINKNTILSWVQQGGSHAKELEKIFSEFNTE